MEDTSSNPLRFETNPYHNVVLKDRKILEITGVKQIDSFDASEFLLETAQGWMVISGKDLTLGKLDTKKEMSLFEDSSNLYLMSVIKKAKIQNP